MESQLATENLTLTSLLDGKPLPAHLSVEIVFGVSNSSNNVCLYTSKALSMQQSLLLKQYLGSRTATYQILDKEELAELIKQEEGREEVSTDAEEDFNLVFEDAVKQNASDIHIFTDPEDPHILFRVNGELYRIQTESRFNTGRMERLVRSIYGSMTGDTGSNKNAYQPERTQSATVQEQRATDGKKYRLRYQDAQLDGDEKCTHVTLRLLDLDRDFSNGTLCDLGYEEDQQRLIYDVMLKGGGGLVIIVGATGDGKTTTGATVLGRLAKEHKGRKMIVTVEDPVEFKIDGVRHTQVQPLEGESDEEAWERHLAAMMRRDPDFIFQGEMRTKSTAESATHAALTGHTTLVTLHGNSAFDAFNRLIELDVPQSLLGTEGFLKGIVFQRLLPVLCQHCSIRVKDYEDNLQALIDTGCATTPLIHRLFMGFGNFLEHVRFRNYEGCDHCRTGLVGRVAAVETLLLDHETRQHILNGNIDQARQSWMGQKGESRLLDPQKTLEEHYTQHCVGFTAFDHAVKKMLLGKISPVDVEDKLGVLTQAKVFSDEHFAGHEVGAVIGSPNQELNS